MKLHLPLPPLLVTSARSACITYADGTLYKPTMYEEHNWDVSCVTNMERMFAETLARNSR